METVRITKGMAFDAVAFLARAVSTDENRDYMQVIKVEKDRGLATDGRRLHVTNCDMPIPEGYWKPASVKALRRDTPKTTDDGVQ